MRTVRQMPWRVGVRKEKRTGKEGRKGEVQSKVIERKVKRVLEKVIRRGKKQKRERKTKTDQKQEL